SCTLSQSGPQTQKNASPLSSRDFAAFRMASLLIDVASIARNSKKLWKRNKGLMDNRRIKTRSKRNIVGPDYVRLVAFQASNFPRPGEIITALHVSEANVGQKPPSATAHKTRVEAPAFRQVNKTGSKSRPLLPGAPGLDFETCDSPQGSESKDSLETLVRNWSLQKTGPTDSDREQNHASGASLPRSFAVGGPSSQSTFHPSSRMMTAFEPAGTQASCTNLPGM